MEIFFEQSKWLVSVRTDDYFAVFAVLGLTAVGGDEVDVILRTFSAHRARLRLNPGICGHGQGGLGLSESLHQFYARQFQPFLVYARIESLSRYRAIFEGGYVEL